MPTPRIGSEPHRVRARLTPMRHRLVPLLVLPVLALVGCGDDGGDTTTVPGVDVRPREVLDTELIVLAEGEPPPVGGSDEPQVLDPADPEAVAALFVEGERDAVVEAVEAVELDGRILLGGIVHGGCFPAGAAVLAVVDGEVSLDGDHLHPDEGEVDCARSIITTAVVAVDPADLPAGFATEPDGPGTGAELPARTVLIEPTGYEGSDVAAPGLVRDRVDLDALYGRYDLGEPDPEVRADVESGEVVLVAAVVGDECAEPVEAVAVREGDTVELVAGYGPNPDEDLVCDALYQAIAVVAVDAAEVDGVTTVNGSPVDAPVGVGVVHVVEPLGDEAEPLAGRLDEVDLSVLAGVDVDIDLEAPADDAVRLVFVVEACQPDTAELVADTGSGTVRAVAQQGPGAQTDCEALSPHLVIADLAADHADLEPVTDRATG